MHSLTKTLCYILLFVSAICTSVISWAGDNPWPEIRQQRIQKLLPVAMQKAAVDAWVILCRENNNDPLADHVGCENAGSTAVFVFYMQGGKLASIAFSPAGEATALQETGVVEQVIAIPRGESALTEFGRFITEHSFSAIAINSSETNAQADGLSFTQRKNLESVLSKQDRQSLVSSQDLVYHWLSIKLPEEVDIMRKAAQLTSQWQYEAYAQVVPGETSDADIARFLKQKMADAGVKDGWAPAQNPSVNSGPDRGHSHATDRVIMPGDVIQVDFGIKLHDRWVSDIQRFAYVLKENESTAPKHISQYWQHAVAGADAAFKAMKPGVRGVDVDRAQRAYMSDTGSLPVMWSTGHPVGYVAHDTGPNLGGSASPEVRPASQKRLEQGMVFAFDGFYSWPYDEKQTKTISVEDMVVITQNGAQYLIPPQRQLILIKPK